jgi:hypothetical protein
MMIASPLRIEGHMGHIWCAFLLLASIANKRFTLAWSSVTEILRHFATRADSC